jgi:chromosome segregation ATPase
MSTTTPTPTDPRIAALEEKIKAKELEVEKASAKVTLLLEAIDALPADSPELAKKEKDLAEWKSERDTLKTDLKDLEAKLKELGTPNGMSHLFAFLFRT